MLDLYVTKIEEVKGNRRLVSVNDEPAFLLSESQIKELHLNEGMHLDEGICGRIEQLLTRNAIQRAMQILEKRDKTEKELRQILRGEHFSERQTDAAVAFVKEQNYLNDARYAENYIRTRIRAKSRQELKNLLRMRGIAEEDLETAFLEVQKEAPDDETVLIRRWMEKKCFDPENASAQDKKKFMAFLMRKGFSYGDILEAFEQR